MRAGDPRLWIWAEALQLLRGAEQRQRQFFAVVSSHSLPCWEPLVDAYQQGDELKLFVALPGVSAAQIEVVLEENGLVVRGHRPRPGPLQRAASIDPANQTLSPGYAGKNNVTVVDQVIAR